MRSATFCRRNYGELAQLDLNFVESARTFGQLIISEQGLSAAKTAHRVTPRAALPLEQKTIKPTKLGGVAGGEKFVHRGILFKFARDPVVGVDEKGRDRYLYGGKRPNTEAAIKGNIHFFFIICFFFVAVVHCFFSCSCQP